MGCAVKSLPRLGHDRSVPGSDNGVALTLVGDEIGLKYFASFHNDLPKPLFLVIGTIMANDKWLCPSRIELLITGPSGKTRHQESSLGCPNGVLGAEWIPSSFRLRRVRSILFQFWICAELHRGVIF